MTDLPLPDAAEIDGVTSRWNPLAQSLVNSHRDMVGKISENVDCSKLALLSNYATQFSINLTMGAVASTGVGLPFTLGSRSLFAFASPLVVGTKHHLVTHDDASKKISARAEEPAKQFCEWAKHTYGNTPIAKNAPPKP